MDIDDPRLARTAIGKRLKRLEKNLNRSDRGLRLLRVHNAGARGGYILEVAFEVEKDQMPAWDASYEIINRGDT